MSGTEGPIRIGDQEREAAVARLGAHYEAGRLSAEEHQERVGEALQAKTDADLAALFTDLPGEGYAGTPGAGGPGDEQGWAGPWGWARPPWTAPSEHAGAAAFGPGAAGADGPGRAAYAGGPGARGPWGGGRAAYGPGFFGRVPLPMLLALAVFGVLASIGCVVAGGHPPFLPLLLVVAGIFIVKRRRQERRA
ncbi:putative secreted protein with PEP-CTERM sorting signal [Kribbella voronezhensis]|uniref:Putative secreted protein with PEP-CTERM sorting signal n=1 Tax=Kribbella voronezhensis TaxID=2512212 RepID=A0A4R7TA78_9ACTN|nr:DUF1707 domain-containing protein [Kribbella voronezhensis]TDU88276.1 putative secreted protein with PEP-CTERM sorting signal [Kribbella voronezhensis]